MTILILNYAELINIANIYNCFVLKIVAEKL